MATIITKNSSTASSVPSAAQLVQGELAVNVTDRRLFTENSGGTVVELGTNPSSLTLPNGTANGVAYLNGSKVLTTGSALTFDGANLGVGTNSPAAKLGVAGNVFISGASPYIAFDTTQSGSTPAFIQYASSSLIFGAGSSEQMRLTSTGLGIGTSSPQYKGHFFTNANSGYGIQVGGTSGVAGDYTGILMSAANASGASPYYSGAIRIQTTVNSPSTQEPVMAFMLQDAGTFALANMTEKMRLTGSGNLGLGVTPSAWGSVVGKAFEGPNSGAISHYIAGGGVVPSVYFSSNAWHNGTNWIYKTGGNAALYSLNNNNGSHYWSTAPSGTAGNAITFTQAMTLDSLGRLGVGTTNPLARIVASNAGAEGLELSPVAGYISGAYIQAYNRSTSSYMPLEFNATTIAFYNNANERARIDSSGNLLVGTTDSSTNQQGYAWNINSGGSFGRIGHANGTASGTAYLAFQYNGGVIGTITQSGTTAVLYNVTSDQRLKQNIVDAPEFGSVIDSIKVRSYDWKADGNHQRAGFIAQELVTVAPEAVHQPEDPEQMMAVDYSKLVPMLVKEIQSLRKRLAAAGIA